MAQPCDEMACVVKTQTAITYFDLFNEIPFGHVKYYRNREDDIPIKMQIVEDGEYLCAKFKFGLLSSITDQFVDFTATIKYKARTGMAEMIQERIIDYTAAVMENERGSDSDDETDSESDSTETNESEAVPDDQPDDGWKY
jgi:hypothetical protein